MTDAHESSDRESAVGILVRLARLVDLTDHARGRIVTRVSLADLPSVLALLRGIDVERGLRLIPGLQGYDVSVWSRSATINYDPSVLPEDFWKYFGAIKTDPSAEGVVRERLYALMKHGADKNQIGRDDLSAKE